MANTTDNPTAIAAESSAEANPKKAVDPASSSTAKSDPPPTTGTTVGSVAADNTGPVNDIEKKIRRAERFGVPVQLSEQEKRNSRAERFGTASSTNGSESSKQSEELKRKARAERFGLPVPSTASDDEAKKKARLARFASDSKTDPAEEEKRKARAIRFSNPPLSSQVNGKGNIEPEAPIAGKGGGGP